MVFGSRSGRGGLSMRSRHSRSISRGRRRIAAVDEHRADQRLAHVGEDRGAPPPAGIRFRIAEPERGAEIDRARDVGAGLAPHQVGEPARQLALVALRERAIAACPRPRGRARGRREIRAAGSCRRAPASAKPPRCASARARGSPCRQTRSRSCLRAPRGDFALRLIERSRTTGSSARPTASARTSRRPRLRRPRRR